MVCPIQAAIFLRECSLELLGKAALQRATGVLIIFLVLPPKIALNRSAFIMWAYFFGFPVRARLALC